MDCTTCIQEKRLAKLEEKQNDMEVKFATVNTKLNVLISILSAIGVAVLTIAIKLVLGVT